MNFWMFLPERCSCGRNATLRRVKITYSDLDLPALQYVCACGQAGEKWPEEHIAAATKARSCHGPSQPTRRKAPSPLAFPVDSRRRDCGEDRSTKDGSKGCSAQPPPEPPRSKGPQGNREGR